MTFYRNVVLLLVVCLIGCAAEPEIEFVEEKVISPEELVAQIQRHADEAESTAKLLQRRRESFRVQMLRQHILDSTAALEQLEAHEQSTEDQIQSARCNQSRLLFVSVQECPEFASHFDEFVENEAEFNSDSESFRLAKGRWLLLKYVVEEGPIEEAKEEITAYWKRFPVGDESEQLLFGLCRRFLGEGELAEAKQTYNVAYRTLEEPKGIKSLKAEIISYQNSEFRKRLTKQKDDLLRTKVLSTIGNRSKGYFIFYSEDPKTRECNYQKCRGINSAVTYVENAQRKRWKWKFIKAYPDTAEGYRKATNHVTKLYGSTTTVKFF